VAAGIVINDEISAFDESMHRLRPGMARLPTTVEENHGRPVRLPTYIAHQHKTVRRLKTLSGVTGQFN
jgi:hypothetical protein